LKRASAGVVSPEYPAAFGPPVSFPWPSKKDFWTFRASSIVAGVLQDAVKDDSCTRGAVFKQSAAESASFS
jgi:hypothetical protein